MPMTQVKRTGYLVKQDLLLLQSPKTRRQAGVLSPSPPQEKGCLAQQDGDEVGIMWCLFLVS